jgi:hypothetical protein
MFLEAKNEHSRKYIFYHQDGLLDIFAGLWILLAGTAMLADMFWMSGIWVVIFVPLWQSARSSITYPRVPAPEALPSQARQSALAISVLIGLLLLSLLAGLAFFIGFERLPAFRTFLGNTILIVLGTGMALMLLVPAIFIQIRRYYAYAVLALAVFILGQLLGWAFWTAMIVTGSLLTLIGLGLLLRFLRTHPLEELR